MFVFSFYSSISYRTAERKEQVIQRRTDRGYAIRSRSDVNYFGRCSIAPSHPETRVPSLNTFYEKVRKTLLLHITFFYICSHVIVRFSYNCRADIQFLYHAGERCSPIHRVFYFSEQNFTSLPSSIMFVVLTAHILPHIEQVCLSAGGVCSKNLLAFSPSSAISNISSQSIL